MELDKYTRFVFLTMMQTALKCLQRGWKQEDFTAFAEGIWESMLLTPPDELQKTLNEIFESDIDELVQKMSAEDESK